jgi:hypothetical protein
MDAAEPYYRRDLAWIHHLGFGFHADDRAPGILAALTLHPPPRPAVIGRRMAGSPGWSPWLAGGPVAFAQDGSGHSSMGPLPPPGDDGPADPIKGHAPDNEGMPTMQSIAAYTLATALVPEPEAHHSRSDNGPNLVARARRLVGRVVPPRRVDETAESRLDEVVPPLSDHGTSR